MWSGRDADTGLVNSSYLFEACSCPYDLSENDNSCFILLIVLRHYCCEAAY